jgi:hypothetical protein
MDCFRGRLVFFVLLVAGLQLTSCSPDLPKDVSEAYDNLPEELDYNLHVKPVLSDKCFSCHGPDKAKQKAGLRLDMKESAYGELPESPGKVAIDPGDLNGSELFHRIMSSDPEYRMPSHKSHLTLSSKEKAILIKWIKQGAEYRPHWAFVKPDKADPPTVKNDDWIINPIDNFILHRLEAENIQPSKPAEKELLLRRLSLDLTGLPPTLDEIDAFLDDNSPDAYEKQVDRLLNSVHYGEKMAVDWLDLARFSDSHGYTVDRIIDMSPYRDWVIQAFNQNFSYDKFIHWQLAGDLMPDPTKEMLIATAFNRVHQQNMEGGIIDEEFRTEYVIDRTNTAGVAFMGLTLGCARCHDHKFDPISHKNYYELFSFFNNIKEAGQISWDDAMPSPTILLPSEDQEKISQFIRTNITTQEENIAKLAKTSEPDFRKWIQSKGYRGLERQKLPQAGLQGYFNFENGSLRNVTHPTQTGVMRRELSSVPGDKPVFDNSSGGKVLVLNGDEWLDLTPIGVFRKSDPFTIGISVFIPSDLKEGVIFHKSVAERLYNYRGYNLYLRDGKLQLSLAHAAPSNAITKITRQPISRDQWIQLIMTYDGSSKASGLKLFQDGKQLEMETTMDQLSKDILLYSKDQPGLQIGAWNRGWGIKGGKVDDILVYNRVLTEFEIKIISGQNTWASVVSKSPEQLSEDELNALRIYYVAAVSPESLAAQQELKRMRSALSDSSEKMKEVMVMQEMPERRKAYVLERGNYDQFGEEVFPSVPESILPFPIDLPRNRLGLATWLTDANHPLTARVAVNRYWQNFFGTGLVKTAEDFGNQGELPSHLKLLDWLAVTFIESGWDAKKMCKMIVMSATYRQDSRATPYSRENDLENRLLSHGPAVRMSAEMIRDNALMASGLLNKKIGGKSVKPYQPPGLWEINNTTYTADSGDDVYRRSLYVLVKRSVPNPTLATFDATSRSYCVIRRQQTNTPLQALVTLNDPTFVEAAKVIGEQMSNATDVRQAIAKTYRKLTGLMPSDRELELLEGLRQKELTKFREDPKRATGWLGAGQSTVGKNVDPAMVAANAVVASVILNSDATLMKR